MKVKGLLRRAMVRLGWAWPLDPDECGHPRASWFDDYISYTDADEKHLSCANCGSILKLDMMRLLGTRVVTPEGVKAGLR